MPRVFSQICLQMRLQVAFRVLLVRRVNRYSYPVAPQSSHHIITWPWKPLNESWQRDFASKYRRLPQQMLINPWMVVETKRNQSTQFSTKANPPSEFTIQPSPLTLYQTFFSSCKHRIHSPEYMHCTPRNVCSRLKAILQSPSTSGQWAPIQEDLIEREFIRNFAQMKWRKQTRKTTTD